MRNILNSLKGENQFLEFFGKSDFRVLYVFATPHTHPELKVQGKKLLLQRSPMPRVPYHVYHESRVIRAHSAIARTNSSR